MSETSDKSSSPILNNPMETFPGLTINDLNRYLPAVRTMEDFPTESDYLSEGMFLSNCLSGLEKMPNESIDLIIANPFNQNQDFSEFGRRKTLQDYYQWNHSWLRESQRVLKNTGAVYLFTPWQYSGMYQGLLENLFYVQTRITWHDRSNSNTNNTWKNETSDIWFVTKSDEFLFKQHPIGVNTVDKLKKNDLESNLWLDIPSVVENNGQYSQKLYLRILEFSSFKLNWVLDPFMGLGDVGMACKNKGRRFIGFETNKDNLLLSMKRVENS